MLAMFDTKTHLGFRGPVRSKLVRDHDVRRGGGGFQEPRHQPPCGRGVPPTLDQDIENEAILIDGAPQPMRFAGNRDDNLIHVPFVAARRSPLAELLGEGLAEFLPPDAPKPLT